MRKNRVIDLCQGLTMKRASKTPSIYAVSRSRHRVQLASDWRYFAFFRLLQISSSYWLAHLIETGLPKPAELPWDFDAVAQVYRRFKDVWSRPYWDWWFEIGQYEFGSSRPPAVIQLGSSSSRQALSNAELEQLSTRLEDYYSVALRRAGLPATILLSVPITGDKKVLLKQINELYEEAAAASDAPRTPAPFQPIRNKIRDETVDQAIRAVHVFAEYPDEALFALGDRAKFAPEYVDKEARDAMTQLVSRHLLHAYRLAENAARGQFPSLASLADEKASKEANRPKFDYVRLREQLRGYAKLSAAALSRLPPYERANEWQFAGSNRTIRYDPGLMKDLQRPYST